MLFDQQFGQHALAVTTGRTLMPQSMLMSQSNASQSVMLAHQRALQEQSLPPSFFAQHAGLVGHPGFNPFSGLPPPSGLTVFPGLSGFSGLQEYQPGLLPQQRTLGSGQEMQHELAKNEHMSTGASHMTQAMEAQLANWQEHHQGKRYTIISTN